jgi:hypothetical protein
METEKDPKIASEFKRKRKIQIYLVVVFIIIFVLFFLATESPDIIPGLSEDIMAIVLIIFAVLATIISMTSWRCPACNAYLGKGFNPKFCSKCGKLLQ